MKNEKLAQHIQTVISILDERRRRIYLAVEAEALGRGGKYVVGKIAIVNKSKRRIYKKRFL